MRLISNRPIIKLNVTTSVYSVTASVYSVTASVYSVIASVYSVTASVFFCEVWKIVLKGSALKIWV